MLKVKRLGARKPKLLTRIAKISLGCLYLQEGNVGFNNNYIIFSKSTVRSFGFLAPNLLTLSIPDDGYSRNMLCS
jgi:hypothetical protein